MTPSKFATQLQRAQQARASDWALLLQPRLHAIPLPMQRYDDPFLPFGKAIIDATRDLLCAYVFDLAAYLAIGAAGAVALERTIAYARTDDVTVAILHAPFVGSAFAEAAGDNAFNADAVTLYAADAPSIAAYQEQGIGVFPVSNAIVVDGIRLTASELDLNICIAGARVLYAGRGDDFAACARSALESL